MDHVVAFAPFRKAISQLQARQADSTSDSACQPEQSPPEPSARARPPIVASTTSSSDPGQGSGWTEAPPLQDVLFDYALPSVQHPLTAAGASSAFGLEDQAALPAGPRSVPEPTAEDYIRAADQMGEYITWDMSEISFMPSAQDFEWMQSNPGD